LSPCDGIVDFDNIEEATTAQFAEYANCKLQQYAERDAEQEAEEARREQVQQCRAGRLEWGVRLVADGVLAASYAYGLGLLARGGLQVAVGATEYGLLGHGLGTNMAAGAGRIAAGSGMMLGGSNVIAGAASVPGLSLLPTNAYSFNASGGTSACSGL
jgi:hypothetical protein